MTEKEIIDEFSDMWGKEIGSYALIKSGRSFGYTIMNTVYNAMVIIEDNEAARYVIKRMIEKGARIADNESEVKNPNRPLPLFLSSEHEAQYRALQSGEKVKRKKK